MHSTIEGFGYLKRSDPLPLLYGSSSPQKPVAPSRDHASLVNITRINHHNYHRLVLSKCQASPGSNTLRKNQTNMKDTINRNFSPRILAHSIGASSPCIESSRWISEGRYGPGKTRSEESTRERICPSHVNANPSSHTSYTIDNHRQLKWWT